MQKSSIVTRQRSKTNPNIQNTPSTSTDVGEDENFLFRIDSLLTRTPPPIIDLQTPESQIGIMEDISLSGVLTNQADRQTNLIPQRSPTTWRSRNTTKRILNKPKKHPSPTLGDMETTPSQDIQTKQRLRTRKRKKMKSHKPTLKKRLHFRKNRPVH